VSAPVSPLPIDSGVEPESDLDSPRVMKPSRPRIGSPNLRQPPSFAGA
jgi:hypothetical protein